jgi:hypothetical protein
MGGVILVPATRGRGYFHSHRPCPERSRRELVEGSEIEGILNHLILDAPRRAYLAPVSGRGHLRSRHLPALSAVEGSAVEGIRI